MVGNLVLVAAAGLLHPARAQGADPAPRATPAPHAVPITVINSARAARRLLGKHDFALQWISWKRFGIATVVDDQGTWRIRASQRGERSDDAIDLEGVVREIDRRAFTFEGRIVTRVSHINDGRPCERRGRMRFEIRKQRRYWRLREMDNPCARVVDYVDIFFRRPRAKPRRR
jgi:hypothetical protein